MKSKRFFAFITCLISAAALMLASAVSVAADEAATVNGQAVKAGDTVTYEYRMGSIEDPLEAAGAVIKYDAKSLEYIDGSLGFDVFSNAIYSIDDGSINYSAIDVINGFDFSSEGMVVKASFKVLDGASGDIKITHSFTEIFTLVNEDTDLSKNDYKETILTTVNTYTSNDAPNKGLDAEEIQEFGAYSDTDIDEYLLGTDKDAFLASNASISSSTTEASAVVSGENSSKADSKLETEITSEAESDSVSIADSAAESSDPLRPEVTLSDNPSPNEGKGFKTSVLILSIVAAIIIVVAVVVVVMKKKENNKE